MILKIKFWAFWYIYWLCSGTGSVGCRETWEAETGESAHKPRQSSTAVKILELPLFVIKHLAANLWSQVAPIKMWQVASQGPRSKGQHFSLSFLFFFRGLLSLFFSNFLVPSSLYSRDLPSKLQFQINSNLPIQIQFRPKQQVLELKLYAWIPINQGKGGVSSPWILLFGVVLGF